MTQSAPTFRSQIRLALGLAVFLSAGMPLTHAEAPAKPVHVLRNGPLQAEVMDPTHPDRYNRGVRFTPVAAVLRSNLGDQSFFYAPPEHDPIADHGGLATEFDLCIPDGPRDDLPPGYTEAKPGDGFLKIGVGVLRKDPGPYDLFHEPQIIEPAQTTVQWKADSAAFRQTSRGVRGLAYELDAVVSVRKDRIVVDWRLKNTGTRKLATKQYTHNFFRFGNRDITEGYVLRFPYDFQAMGLETGQQQEGRAILFLKEIPQWINAVVQPPPGYAGPNRFILENRLTGQSIQADTSVPGLRTAIHARKSYIAPEQFILISLAPGEEKSWQRTYRFSSIQATHP